MKVWLHILGESDFNRSLFAPNFKYEVAHVEEYKSIAEKLKAVKVLDPACGSGAFPMGLLNRMAEVLQRIELNTKRVWTETGYYWELSLR